MSPRPGEALITIRYSHTWMWLPRPYRHISGGLGIHWLNLFMLVHNTTMDRKTAEQLAKQLSNKTSS